MASIGRWTRDAGPSTRAIRSGPVSESQVFDVFDWITYNKGGAVLAMLEQWVGEKPFRAAWRVHGGAATLQRDGRRPVASH